MPRGFRAQRYERFETLVVDNGSSDGSQELLRTRFAEVRVLELGENRGFAAAMNEGIGAAQTPLVAFLNNDTRAEPDWLGELVACLERHPRAAAAASKLLIYSTGRIDGAGDSLRRQFRPSARQRATRRRPLRTGDRGVRRDGRRIALAREVLDELGAFDEAFFAYFKDVDLSFRALLGGWRSGMRRARSCSIRRGTSASYSGLQLLLPDPEPLVSGRQERSARPAPAARAAARLLRARALGTAVYRRKVGAMLRAYRDVASNRCGCSRSGSAIQAVRKARTVGSTGSWRKSSSTWRTAARLSAIVAAFLFLREPHAAQRGPRAPMDGDGDAIEAIDHIAIRIAAAVRNPGSGTCPHHRLERRDEPARRMQHAQRSIGEGSGECTARDSQRMMSFSP